MLKKKSSHFCWPDNSLGSLCWKEISQAVYAAGERGMKFLIDSEEQYVWSRDWLLAATG